MSDRDLVRQLKARDTIAFRQLVEQFKEKVVNTCFRFLANEEDAEDIAQEVFIEVLRSVSGFREEASLSTWIHRIAVSKSLDFIRSQKRQKRLGLVKQILRLEDAAYRIPAPRSANPEANLEDQERIHILNQALASLPENQRVAITLSKYEAFSNQEVADIMATSLSAVEALIHRAKQTLKKKLYRYYAVSYTHLRAHET